ncbi:Protein MAK16 [Cladophialophora chaetospira]|uniref:Protein MAK16 n=1 Tax=Cladophialophora chaetospira TaxID=386627 RepID=A0AA38XF12_9EURO|nr:Protein MAK16 [Cladophialophora chaetospira]
MSSDEIVWQVINQQFCSFKLKLNSKEQTFCRNEYNLTGFCNRQSCPLANSRYATIRPDPETGALCLFMKTPERTHLPSKWWEKINLPNNYEKALAAIDDKLQYWPRFYIHKCKQRLTRLTQVRIRQSRILKEETRLGEKNVSRLAPKVRRREETRERKAESAAKVEREIERELMERLTSGAYGDRPINIDEGLWKKVLRGLERKERGDELADEEELEDEAEEEREAEVEYVTDLEESEDELEQEMEDFDDWLEGESPDEEDDEVGDDGTDESDEEGSEESEDDEEAEAGKKRKRGAKQPSKPQKKPRGRVEIEYEMEPPLKETILA